MLQKGLFFQNEVKQAEVACLTVADEICCLHCTMHDDGTETVSIRSIEGIVLKSIYLFLFFNIINRPIIYFSPEKKLKISQSAPAIACELHSRNQSKLKKKSVSFGVFSFPIVTHPIRLVVSFWQRY